jgi:hypothetical protein
MTMPSGVVWCPPLPFCGHSPHSATYGEEHPVPRSAADQVQRKRETRLIRCTPQTAGPYEGVRRYKLNVLHRPCITASSPCRWGNISSSMSADLQGHTQQVATQPCRHTRTWPGGPLPWQKGCMSQQLVLLWHCPNHACKHSLLTHPGPPALSSQRACSSLLDSVRTPPRAPLPPKGGQNACHTHHQKHACSLLPSILVLLTTPCKGTTHSSLTPVGRHPPLPLTPS